MSFVTHLPIFIQIPHLWMKPWLQRLWWWKTTAKTQQFGCPHPQRSSTGMGWLSWCSVNLNGTNWPWLHSSQCKVDVGLSCRETAESQDLSHKERVLKHFAAWLIEDDLPFTTGETLGIKQLFKYLEITYQLPSNTTIWNALARIYIELHGQVVHELSVS